MVLVLVPSADAVGLRRRLDGGDTKAVAAEELDRDSGETYCGNACDMAPGSRRPLG